MLHDRICGEIFGRFWRVDSPAGVSVNQTLYRRPLPPDATEFSSAAGRQLFAEALAAGGLDGYFRLAEQFHTQAEPEFCGLG
ncbi:MAG: hypothetical protein H0T65_03150, partial [Deltaproteobacteria bacterium]|nr:hypothetical protein [Deltaproteobacteria bacterium]